MRLTGKTKEQKKDQMYIKSNMNYNCRLTTIAIYECNEIDRTIESVESTEERTIT